MEATMAFRVSLFLSSKTFFMIVEIAARFVTLMHNALRGGRTTDGGTIASDIAMLSTPVASDYFIRTVLAFKLLGIILSAFLNQILLLSRQTFNMKSRFTKAMADSVNVRISLLTNSTVHGYALR
jgi:hypothetical protein